MPEWNNCFIKNNHQISLKSCHVLFRKILSWTAKRFSSAAIVSTRGKRFQNFSCCADAYTYHICRAWYNGSYTMATKPIKFLELHYTMTQFLKKYTSTYTYTYTYICIIYKRIIKKSIKKYKEHSPAGAIIQQRAEVTLAHTVFKTG